MYGGKSFTQIAHPGDTVNFSCRYAEEDADIKVVYRVSSHSITALIFTYERYVEKDRYVLHVSEDKVMNMSIMNVTEADEGVYLCGTSKHLSKYARISCEIQLQVTGEY